MCGGGGGGGLVADALEWRLLLQMVATLKSRIYLVVDLHSVFDPGTPTGNPLPCQRLDSSMWNVASEDHVHNTKVCVSSVVVTTGHTLSTAFTHVATLLKITYVGRHLHLFDATR
jgi:hypothetical protein